MMDKGELDKLEQSLEQDKKDWFDTAGCLVCGEFHNDYANGMQCPKFLWT